MNDVNVPWKYSHIKCLLGYRKWEALKHFNDKSKKQQLLEALNAGKRILFVHVPKTAGVSLIRAYQDCFAAARHSPVLLYKLLLGDEFAKFLTFSIVRNPWARIYSAYSFLTKGGLSGTDPAMAKVLNEACPTFEVFVKEWLPEHGVCSYGHFVPQHEYICGWGKASLVEYLLKLEGLNDGWPDLAQRLGLPIREIGRENKSTNEEYRKYYDNESIDMVSRLYARDIELLTYSYE